MMTLAPRRLKARAVSLPIPEINNQILWALELSFSFLTGLYHSLTKKTHSGKLMHTYSGVSNNRTVRNKRTRQGIFSKLNKRTGLT